MIKRTFKNPELRSQRLSDKLKGKPATYGSRSRKLVVEAD